VLQVDGSGLRRIGTWKVKIVALAVVLGEEVMRIASATMSANFKLLIPLPKYNVFILFLIYKIIYSHEY